LISEIDKQSKTTVKQETADTLVNKSDPKIQALFDAYELK
jgi:hypothetical protein